MFSNLAEKTTLKILLLFATQNKRKHLGSPFVMEIMEDISNMVDGGRSVTSNFKLLIEKTPFLQAPRQSR